MFVAISADVAAIASAIASAQRVFERAFVSSEGVIDFSGIGCIIGRRGCLCFPCVFSFRVCYFVGGLLATLVNRLAAEACELYATAYIFAFAYVVYILSTSGWSAVVFEMSSHGI